MMMIDDVKEKFWGRTVREWLAALPDDLDIDPMGLREIIPTGRSQFRIKGEALEEFTRRALMVILKHGARPVQGAHNPTRWEPVHDYGETPEEIVEAVVAKWLAPGAPDPTHDDVWFAMPKFFGG